MERIKTKAEMVIRSLCKEVKNSSETLYCLLLGVYLLSLLLEKVRFAFSSSYRMQLVQILTVAALILLGVSIASILVMVINRKWALIPALLLAEGMLILCARMQKDMFDGVMIALLAIGTYGKNYEKLLKVYLGCFTCTLAIAMLGVPLGLTVETPKIGRYGTGLSFGFTHPNVWGFYVFITFVIIWLLYIRNTSRRVRMVYLVFSVLLAVFMVFVPKCRTQALLLLLFPIAVMVCKKLATGKRTLVQTVVSWIFIIFPFVCFLLTIFLSTQREWLVVHTFGTYVENFSKRFIQGGLALREHGLPLFGELIRFQADTVEHLGNHDISLYVLDNGYVTYVIYRGMIWMVPALFWLSLGNRRMIQKKDYSLLAISMLLSLMGTMERYPLEMFNFLFLYPIATLEGAGDTAVPAVQDNDDAGLGYD